MARRKNDNWYERHSVREPMENPLSRGRSDLDLLDLAPDLLNCAASVVSSYCNNAPAKAKTDILELAPDVLNCTASMVSSYCNYSAAQSAIREHAETEKHRMDVKLWTEAIRTRKEQQLGETESKLKMYQIQSDAEVKLTQLRAEADIKREEIRAEVRKSEIRLQYKELEEKIAELKIGLFNIYCLVLITSIVAVTLF